MSVADIGASTLVAPGAAIRIDLAGRELCIARDSEGTVHAIDNLCTHGEVSLAQGDVEGCTIECWLHGSSFDLRTGAALTPPAFEPVAVYSCQEVEGRILVDPEVVLNAS